MKALVGFAILVLLCGCATFLPPGVPPESITGTQRTPDKTMTLSQAESAMSVSITRFVIVNQLAPVRIAISDKNSGGVRFFQSLDTNLFHFVPIQNAEYFLVSIRKETEWTLSLKKIKTEKILWSKTISSIQLP